MRVMFLMAVVTGMLLQLNCGLNEPERTAFSDGKWREVDTPNLGEKSFFITVSSDSFHLEDRMWMDVIPCLDTSCTATFRSTFAKGTIAEPGEQMVAFSGMATDSLFSAISDSAGNQIPFYALYLYTWIGDTLVLVRDNGTSQEQRKMVKQ